MRYNRTIKTIKLGHAAYSVLKGSVLLKSWFDHDHSRARPDSEVVGSRVVSNHRVHDQIVRRLHDVMHKQTMQKPLGIVTSYPQTRKRCNNQQELSQVTRRQANNAITNTLPLLQQSGCTDTLENQTSQNNSHVKSIRCGKQKHVNFKISISRHLDSFPNCHICHVHDCLGLISHRSQCY